MCVDIHATMADLADKGIVFKGAPEERRFGRAVTMVLPGQVEVLLYEPSHPTAV
jgi:hypothetical protein